MRRLVRVVGAALALAAAPAGWGCARAQRPPAAPTAPAAGAVDPLAAAEARWTQRMAGEPGLRSALQLKRGEVRLARGDRAGARGDGEAVYALQPPWADEAAWLVARASVPCKDQLEWADRAPARADVIPWVPRAALQARAHTACGDPSAAQALWRSIALKAPWTAEAGEATAALGPAGALSAEDRLAQALAWEGYRDYPQALTVLAGLAAGPLGARARFEAARIRLDRERTGFLETAEAFEALAAEGGPQATDAAYWAAKARGRAGAHAQAAQAYRRFAADHPAHARAGDALFFAAFLAYERGAFREAAAAFAERSAMGRMAGSAAWYHAWSLYLAGDPAAPAALLRLAAPEGDRAGRRAAYWASRALEAGSPGQAAALAVRLVAHDPLGWYSLLVQRRAPGIFADLPALPARPAHTQAATATGAEPAVGQALALHAAGLPRLARRALAAVAPGLVAAGAHPALREAALSVDAPALALLNAVVHGRSSLKAWPAADDQAGAAVWRAAWPRGFARWVDPAAARHGVPPAWVYAFIRKESAFRPEVVSPAHAMGLMQILDRTAAGVAAAGGPGRGDLFSPADNIDTGTWYVAALSARFGAQLPLVAAAYNAGPAAVRAWAARGPAQTDVFVERIPYLETRGYVRKLIEGVVRQRMVHEGASLQSALKALPLELELRVAPGVEF